MSTRHRRAAHDHLGYRRFAERLQQPAAGVAGRACPRRPGDERRQHEALGGAGGDERDLVDTPRLTEPIDPPDALLDARRAPRQLVVQHDPAVMVEVEPFGRGVGRQQEESARVERSLDSIALVPLQPSVQRRQRPAGRPDQALQAMERVAVFGEHDDRLADARQPAQEARRLALGP